MTYLVFPETLNLCLILQGKNTITEGWSESSQQHESNDKKHPYDNAIKYGLSNVPNKSFQRKYRRIYKAQKNRDPFT